ncbi:MAG: hypothetical protein QXG16_05095 [Candidatus Anstonellaceae archaeon]
MVDKIILSASDKFSNSLMGYKHPLIYEKLLKLHQKFLDFWFFNCKIFLTSISKKV